MNRILSVKDIKLIANFYQKLNILDEDLLKNIITSIDKTRFMAANINNGEITSIVSLVLIKNNYYLQNLMYLNYNEIELSSLLEYLIDKVHDEPLGVNIIFSNYPFNGLTDKILINANFKYTFINYIDNSSYKKIEKISSNFYLNDKSEDVINYLKINYENVINKTNSYLGIKTSNEVNEIDLNNTNTAVIRDHLNKVIGVSRFGLIGDEMLINSIYADNEEVYLELLNLIKSLTSKNLSIGVMPVRNDLIEILNRNGYIKNQADYIYKVVGGKYE